LQEENSKQQIKVVVKLAEGLGKGTAKITSKTLLAISKKLATNYNESHKGKKISFGKLIRQGGGFETVKIDNSNIGRFKHSARKFGVEFSIKRDKQNGDRYICFKARDKDAISQAIEDFYVRDKKYRNTVVYKGKEKVKASIIEKINKTKQQLKEGVLSAPERKRNKGEISI